MTQRPDEKETDTDGEETGKIDERPTIKIGVPEKEDNTLRGSDPFSVQRTLKRSFVVTLLAGSALILGRNPIGVSGIQSMFVVSLMMLLYWLYNWKRAGITKSVTARGVFGDSFYYLGFLFTFVALVAVMVQLGQDDFSIDSIIGSMGPALITTVLGMSVRIYLTQFDPITAEPELETIASVGELASNVTAAAEGIQTAMNAVTKSSQEAMQSVMDANKRIIEETTESNRLALTETTTKSQEVIKSIEHNIDTNLSSFAERLETPVLRNASEQISRIAETLSAYEESAQQLRNFAENTTGPTSETLRATLNRMSEAADKIEKASERTDTSEKTLDLATTSLSNAFTDINKKLEEVENLKASSGEAHKEFQVAKHSLESLNNSLLDISKNIDKFKHDTMAQASLFKEATERVITFIKENR